MPGLKPVSPVQIDERTQKLLERMLRRETLPRRLERRIQIILKAAQGHSNSQIACDLGVDRNTVRLWRARWAAAQEQIETAWLEGASDSQMEHLLEQLLADAPRPGAPDKFTPEQRVAIIALSCEPPALSNRPVSHWTPRELANEAVRRGIVPSISARTVGWIWDEADLKPHRVRYWRLRPRKSATCISALPNCTLPESIWSAAMRIPAFRPWNARRPPCRCSRVWWNGKSLSISVTAPWGLIANLEVATGQITTPTLGPTRTETDFVAHIAQTVATDPEGVWIFIVDNLNIH
jgi:transposase